MKKLLICLLLVAQSGLIIPSFSDKECQTDSVLRTAMKTYDYNHCRTSSPYNLPDVYDTQDLETFSQVDQQIANAIVSIRNKKTVDYVISNENTRNPNHVYIQVDSKESLDRKNNRAYLLKLYSATTTTFIAYFSLKAFYGYVKSK